MDKVKLNNSPDLTMEQITKQLFNNEELSDIQFQLEGKILYAHSWELMKRSIVFYEQFKGTLGENKFIVIKDTEYNAFYEFLRFIYTDQFTIGQDMICEMLRLAVKYKIVKLETAVLAVPRTIETRYKLIEFYVVNKYELGKNDFFDELFGCHNHFTDTFLFYKFSSNIWEGILMCNFMPPEITEIKLFITFVRWMDRQCELNAFPCEQQRLIYDGLLKLIRFASMTTCEFDSCVQRYPDLFADEDIRILNNVIARRHPCVDSKWIYEPRCQYIPPWETQENSNYRRWETAFTVSKNLILHGLRFGSGFVDFQLTISRKNRTSNAITVLKINVTNLGTRYNIISLGESIQLKPGWEYTITTKDLSSTDIMVCRKPTVNVIVTGPKTIISFRERSPNLFEIFLNLSTDQNCACLGSADSFDYSEFVRDMFFK